MRISPVTVSLPPPAVLVSLGRIDRTRDAATAITGQMRSPSTPLWHRLLGRSVSESGRLCHGNGDHERGDRYRRGLALAILWPRDDDLSRKRDPWPTLDPGPLEVIWKAGWTRDGSEKAKGRACMHVANSFFAVSIENMFN